MQAGAGGEAYIFYCRGSQIFDRVSLLFVCMGDGELEQPRQQLPLDCPAKQHETFRNENYNSSGVLHTKVARSTNSVASKSVQRLSHKTAQPSFLGFRTVAAHLLFRADDVTLQW